MNDRGRCWACGGPVRAAAYLAPLDYDECESCGLAFRRRAEGARELYTDPSGYEAERGEEYHGDAFDTLRRTSSTRLAYVHRSARPPGDLLDIGTAGGAFLVAARDAGWRCRGIEPMPAAAAFARDHAGLDVATGSVENADLGEDRYDVVTMWHVLEHLEDPPAVLARILRALRPGGRLVVEVPNAASPIARRLGAEWMHADPEFHVSQFTPGALRTALAGAGLEVEDVHSTSIVPYYSWRMRLGPRTLVHIARSAWWARTPRSVHAHAHEFLRATARA